MLGRSIHKVWAGSVLISFSPDEFSGKFSREGLFEGESEEEEEEEKCWVLFVLFSTFTMMSSIKDSV